jgi:hypothetical protein
MGLADILLRHVTRQHPEGLVRAFLPLSSSGERIERVEVLGWADTQVTALERRLDKVLLCRLSGEKRALHAEVTLDFVREIPYRILDYQSLLFLSLRGDMATEVPPPIQSVVIVLRGRKESWPSEGELRTGWPESPWSGVRYRIDAVYQRSVEELRARGDVLWLVFTPLAHDATAAAMREVLGEIRAQARSDEERADMFAALLLMADIDPWGHNLRKEMERMLDELDRRLLDAVPGYRDAYDRGKTEGREEGRREVVEVMLRDLVVKHLGRSLMPSEEEELERRLHGLDADKAAEVVRMPNEALLKWVLGSNGEGKS